jgi:hypothetical protein
MTFAWRVCGPRAPRSLQRRLGGEGTIRRLAAVRELDHQRVRELQKRELSAFRARTCASEALFRRAQRTLPGCVASSFQRRAPWPVYATRGEGPRGAYHGHHDSAMVSGEQEWSLTVAHDAEAIDRYIEVFSEPAAALSPRPSGSARA